MTIFSTKNYTRKFIFLIPILCFVLPHIIHAATLTFDAQDSTVGTTGSFSVGLNITAKNPVNALSLVLNIPSGLEVTDISDGNSIINYWIDKPEYVADKHIVGFSGIIPGGFSGDNARLLVIKMQALQPGSYTLNYDLKDSQIFLNTPNAEPDTISVKPLVLTVVAGKENIDNQIPDTTPPEDFTVDVVQDNVSFNNKWVAIYSTQDKGTGIDHYEVAESWINTKNYSTLSWFTSDSPYLLQDQKRQSYIYVKAVDKAGNARVVVVAPLHPVPWYIVYLRYIIIGILVLILLAFIGFRVMFRNKFRELEKLSGK